MRTLTAILAFAACAASAEDGDARYVQRPGGAEAYYVSSSMVVEVAGIERELDSGRMMLDYAESANDWLYLGISVGLTFDDMQDEPLIADTDPSGYGFGVFAGGRFLETGGFALLAQVRHELVYGEGAGAAQEATLDYSETTAKLGASYRWQTLELAAGAYTLTVDGELESTGGVIGSAAFEAIESSGAWGTLRIRIDGGYSLGLRAESGARETLAFTFSTRF